MKGESQMEVFVNIVTAGILSVVVLVILLAIAAWRPSSL